MKAGVIGIGSALPDHIVTNKAFEAYLDTTDAWIQRRTGIREPAFAVLSNGSTRPFADIRRELAENLLKPVRWREILLELQVRGATQFVECGPGAVLKGLVTRTLKAVA